jgi:cell division transport system permease protein
MKDRQGRLAPREAGAAPLDMVMAIMAFLASLALGASLLAQHAAESWQSGLTGKLTVQIVPPAEGATAAQLDRESAAAIRTLEATPGIARASALSEGQLRDLLVPWIGNGAGVSDLPLPRLIDATLLPGTTVDAGALTARLKTAAPDAQVDDHTRWLGRLRGLANGIVLFAWAILALIAVAAASAVAFATRAGLQSHHELVALLHQMGAHAGFIARVFERHYLFSALAAGALGALPAVVLFAIAGRAAHAGFEPVAFLPSLSLTITDFIWFAAIPLVAGLIAWATARLSVLAAVARIY